MLATLNTLNSDLIGTVTRQSVIAVLSSIKFTVCQVMLYPVKSTVELWIENKDTAGIFDGFLQAGASALEVFLCRQSAVAQRSPPSRRFGLGMHLVF